jgi:LuxR family transcriptional regulator, maltose regulon positive regulatory protein
MALVDLHSAHPVRLAWPEAADASPRSWPVRIRTFGRFEIEIDGAPLLRAGKAQRRPMAMLKVLVALGGSSVPEDRLIEIVWGDAPAGGDQKTFDVTLHRLRKLLGHDKVLIVTDRRVSINRELVWTDLWALERIVGAAAPCWGPAALQANPLERAESDVLALYVGAFLRDEPDTAWLLPVRDRLDSQFRRFIARQGDYWEAQARWDRAAELFERAIENAPLAESFYVRLMNGLRQQDKRTEAVDVYRRLRRLLAVTLGVEPGAPAQALLRDLTAR